MLSGDSPCEPRALHARRRSNNVNIACSSIVSGTQKLDNRTQSLLVEKSDGVRVTDSRFESIWSGINMRTSQNVKLEHNLFSRLGTFAILMTQVSGVEILSKRFNGFATEGSGKAAFIQCQTRGTTEPSRDFLIRNIVMIQDTPPVAHGIFFSNEARIPFERVSVLDNIVVSGTNQSIAFNRAVDVKVERNIVLNWRESTIATGIRIVGVGGAEVTSNHTVSHGLIDSQKVITRRNTTTTRRETRSQKVQFDRIDGCLAGTGSGRVHQERFVTSEHRVSGPRP